MHGGPGPNSRPVLLNTEFDLYAFGAHHKLASSALSRTFLNLDRARHRVRGLSNLSLILLQVLPVRCTILVGALVYHRR